MPYPGCWHKQFTSLEGTNSWVGHFVTNIARVFAEIIMPVFKRSPKSVDSHLILHL